MTPRGGWRGGGRPKKKGPKKQTIAVSLSAHVATWLDRQAEIRGISRSALVESILAGAMGGDTDAKTTND